MRNNLVLDAHALVWFFIDHPSLGNRARTLLSNSGAALIIPVIALAEACWIINKNRTKPTSLETFLEAVRNDQRVRIVDLTEKIVIKAMNLSAKLEMHDSQIVATVLQLQESGENAVLLTKDQAIIDSGLVTVLW